MSRIRAFVIALGLVFIAAPAGAGPQSSLAQAFPFAVTKSIAVPEHPHGIAFSADGRWLYLVSTAGNALTIIDTTTETVTKKFPLTDSPIGIALLPDGTHVAVSHFDADRISRVNLTNGKVEQTITVGPKPSLLVRTAAGDRAYVSCEGANKVFEIDLKQFAVIRSFATGPRPFPPDITSDGRRLFVPDYDSGEVTVIDLKEGRTVATVKVGDKPSGGIVMPYDEDYAVVNRGSNTISFIDLAINEARPGFAKGLDKEPFSMVATKSGRWGFVNNTASANVSVIDLDRYAPAGMVAVGSQPIVMAVHPSDRKLYVSCEGSHEVAVVSIP
jgi:YVTN family beta-propeller protein